MPIYIKIAYLKQFNFFHLSLGSYYLELKEVIIILIIVMTRKTQPQLWT